MAAPKEKEKTKNKIEVNRQKSHFTCAFIGHVDAGKSTTLASFVSIQSEKGLAKAESYEEIDKAPEEKSRGITISAKHIKIETEKRVYTLIDCPGHADYIKNMIVGAAQTEGALLVVSSMGVQAQTIEHLKTCKRLGVEHIVVLVNDKGNIDNDMIKELLSEDVKSSLTDCGYNPSLVPIFFASSLKALNGDKEEREKLSKVIESLDKIPEPKRDYQSPFLMYVESVFQVKGQGTIVGGKVLQGTLKEGDTVQVVGLGKPKKTAVVRSLEMHKEVIKDFARAGDDLGVSLRGLEANDVEKGMVVGDPSINLEPNYKFNAEVYILSKREGRRTPFHTGFKPQFFIHTANITGEIELPQGISIIDPGEKEEKKTNFKVKLISPVYMRKNDTFIIREGGKTIGMGFVDQIDQ